MSQQTVKEAVLATVEAIKKDAAMAKVQYKAQTQWEEDVRCTGRVRHFDPMVIDEPAAFGGGDSAVSPADVVLVALGTCQEIMYVALASTMDIPLDEVKVDVNANLDLNGLMGLDPETPPGPARDELRRAHQELGPSGRSEASRRYGRVSMPVAGHPDTERQGHRQSQDQ